MIDLIRADFRRILNKRSFQLVLALTALAAVVLAVIARFRFWNDLVYVVGQRTALNSYILLVLGLLVFLGVYADEFSAKSFQIAIGHGMPRRRLLAVKILDCIFLSVLMVLCFFVLFALLGLILGARLDGTDWKILGLSVLCTAFVVSCATPLTAALLFATGKTAMCTFAQIVLLSLLPMVLSVMNGILLFHDYHIAEWYITGFAERFYSEAMLYGGGLPRLLLGAALYLGLAYGLSFLAFRKKELEL